MADEANWGRELLERHMVLQTGKDQVGSLDGTVRRRRIRRARFRWGCASSARWKPVSRARICDELDCALANVQ